eukprot:1718999-Prymnesium_polylepis.1
MRLHNHGIATTPPPRAGPRPQTKDKARNDAGTRPLPLQAHTSAPLLVSLQEDDALIIAHRMSCLDF